MLNPNLQLNASMPGLPTPQWRILPSQQSRLDLWGRDERTQTCVPAEFPLTARHTPAEGTQADSSLPDPMGVATAPADLRRSLNRRAGTLHEGCLLLKLEALTNDLRRINRFNVDTLPGLAPQQVEWLRLFAPRIGTTTRSCYDNNLYNKNDLKQMHSETMGAILEIGTFTILDIEDMGLFSTDV